MKQIAILGSTGSIGTQTLDVVRANPDRFEVYAISANRSIDLLVKQAREFRPEVVCIADESLYQPLCEALSDIPIKVWAGMDAIAEMVTMPSIDVVVAAMVGYAGLRPTIEAIKAGKTIALANKETLVVAGEIICRLAQQYHTPILPIDSEHSAIFQSLTGEQNNEIEKILLTASGGPFRTFSREQMLRVTAADALKHPNWDMGAKITIDSASMMNKGFEVIEAKWLFGVEAEKIEVLVHPQSIVHSAVQFRDGAVKAQLGAPDMRLPIQYALTYPDRADNAFEHLSLTDIGTLTFEKPDIETFKCLPLCIKAINEGGLAPTAVNGANEEAVALFLQGKIKFLQIADLVEKALAEVKNKRDYTVEDIFETDKAARKLVRESIF